MISTETERIYTAKNGKEIPKALSAMRGREYWMKLKEQYCPDEETGLIIVQTEDLELISAAVWMVPEYLKRKYLKRVLMVVNQALAANLIKIMLEESHITLIITEREHIEELLDYYRLVQFFSEIVVVSTNEPYGNSHIIGKMGISVENYVKSALYV